MILNDISRLIPELRKITSFNIAKSLVILLKQEYSAYDLQNTCNWIMALNFKVNDSKTRCQRKALYSNY